VGRKGEVNDKWGRHWASGVVGTEVSIITIRPPKQTIRSKYYMEKRDVTTERGPLPAAGAPTSQQKRKKPEGESTSGVVTRYPAKWGKRDESKGAYRTPIYQEYKTPIARLYGRK